MAYFDNTYNSVEAPDLAQYRNPMQRRLALKQWQEQAIAKEKKDNPTYTTTTMQSQLGNMGNTIGKQTTSALKDFFDYIFSFGKNKPTKFITPIPKYVSEIHNPWEQDVNALNSLNLNELANAYGRQKVSRKNIAPQKQARNTALEQYVSGAIY